MLRYALRRLLIGSVTLLGITLVTFAVIRLAPGDPVDVLDAGAERPLSHETYERLRSHFELDRPLLVQYVLWLRRLATGDFGESFRGGERVAAKIGRALWPTVSVAVLSLLVAFAVAVPVGMLSAVRPGGLFDRVASTGLYVLYSVPSYILGMLLAVYLGMKWRWLPFHGMQSDEYESMSALGKLADRAEHYVLITACFACASVAFYSRFVRQSLLEVIRQDYVRTARAKGLPEHRVVIKHAFTNSLLPFITLLGLTFPHVLSGSVILEYLFGWPGLGWLYFESVNARDYPTIMALNFVTAVVVLVTTLLTDLAYGLVDPRVRYD
jgi:peptide/nickel transport system permease protein